MGSGSISRSPNGIRRPGVLVRGAPGRSVVGVAPPPPRPTPSTERGPFGTGLTTSRTAQAARASSGGRTSNRGGRRRRRPPRRRPPLPPIRIEAGHRTRAADVRVLEQPDEGAHAGVGNGAKLAMAARTSSATYSGVVAWARRRIHPHEEDLLGHGPSADELLEGDGGAVEVSQQVLTRLDFLVPRQPPPSLGERGVATERPGLVHQAADVRRERRRDTSPGPLRCRCVRSGRRIHKLLPVRRRRA